MKKIFLSVGLTMACLLLAGAVQVSSALAESDGIQKIALLPFSVNGNENQEYLRKGILQMLSSRLEWPGHVQVVPESHIKSILTRGKNAGKTQMSMAKDIAQKTGSRFVLSGSVTRLGNGFSVDANLFDMDENRYIPFFTQSDNENDFIDKMDRMAAMINQKAFSRTTMTWDTMRQENRASVNERRRRNPEYLMQNPAWQQTKKPVGWKFWKRLF